TTGLVTAQEVVRQVTQEADSGVKFVSGPSIRVQNQSGDNPTFLDAAGPFLMSIDGQGTQFDYGHWRLLTLEHYPALEPLTFRTVNLSTAAYDTIFGTFPDPFGTAALPPAELYPYIELDVGVPEDLAVVNTGDAQVVYVANAPFLGIQAILTQE